MSEPGTGPRRRAGARSQTDEEQEIMKRHEPAGGKDRPGPDWGRYRRRLEHEIGELTRRAVEYVELC